MKKTISILIIVLVLVAGLVVPAQAAACLPPQLPSSFWGYATGIPAGATVTVSGPSGAMASTKTVAYQGKIAYSLDARAFDACSSLPGGKEGDRLTFTVGGRTVGYGVWHGGTNVRLDLKAQAVRFWWQR